MKFPDPKILDDLKVVIFEPRPDWLAVKHVLVSLGTYFDYRGRCLSSELSKAVGCHPSTVRNWLAPHGSEPRYGLACKTIKWLKTQLFYAKLP